MQDTAGEWTAFRATISQKTPEWLATWRKPVIFDEAKYEGISPSVGRHFRGMTRRFWLGMAYGAYMGHGETYLDAREILWWSKGSVLHGESPARVAFLRRIIESGPAEGLAPLPNAYYPCAAKRGDFYLYYLDYHQPAQANFDLPAGARFTADVIDPWAMTVTPAGDYSGKFTMKFPGRPHLAVRFRKVP